MPARILGEIFAIQVKGLAGHGALVPTGVRQAVTWIKGRSRRCGVPVCRRARRRMCPWPCLAPKPQEHRPTEGVFSKAVVDSQPMWRYSNFPVAAKKSSGICANTRFASCIA